jgi:hypothetical protein
LNFQVSRSLKSSSQKGRQFSKGIFHGDTINGSGRGLFR